ncbi:hypothetical protein [Blastopirellula marina]|uniref:NolW-like domain-containing protein n=1 Tax=Blastopirellula marina TaxID=124 RepID=A0A2S8FHH6_9BACT|nr:hypothetical protein [Blastopirellula marina]PQO31651.1 hypothetical protein C5Y98_19745 [Blastopirellula marina]PTL42958.1 hypothetical protein C5Y97_19755 [Blastopirellula marina]
MRVGLVIALILGTVSIAEAQIAPNPFGPARPPEPMAEQETPTKVLPVAHAPAPALDPFGGPSEPRQRVESPKVIWIGPTAQADQKIREKMTAETKIQFINTPLEEITGYLHHLHGINVVISPKVWKQVGPEGNFAISINIEGIRLDSALDFMLDGFDLDWYIQGEMVVITTAEDAKSRMSLRAYSLRNLDGEKLVELLETTIAPDSWKANDGQGNLKVTPGNILTVWQNRRGHELVEATIDTFTQYHLEVSR